MVYALHLYRLNPDISASELSKRMQKASTSVQEAVYSEYNLEKYVRKSNGREGQEHTDIALKLTALIYSSFGYGRVYDFLIPFFEKAENYVDYKSLVQEYAQALKMVPSYKIVNETGPEHEKVVTCCVYVGGMYAEAAASGKKKAEKAAAMAFSEKYKVSPIQKKVPWEAKTGRKMTLTKRRRVELAEAAWALNIDLKYMNTDDLEKALTHKSYSNENKECNYNNETLSILGAHIIRVFFGNYYYECHEKGNETTLALESAAVSDEKTLAKVMPDQILKFINTSKGIKNKKVETAYARLKVSVLRSVIAVLWMNCYKLNKPDAVKYAGSYICGVFEKESLHKKFDYRTLLLDIIQKKKLSIEESFEQVEGTPEDMPTIMSTFVVRHEGRVIEASGYGSSKKEADNNASKAVLAKLRPYIDTGLPAGLL